MAAHAAEVNGHKLHQRKLGIVCLCRGHGYLRPGPGIEHILAFAGYAGADNIDYAQRMRAAYFGFAQGEKRIKRLPALADYYYQGVGVYHGVVIAELACKVARYGNFCIALYGVARNHANVICRAAGHDIHPLKAAYNVRIYFAQAKLYLSVFYARRNGAAYGVRLLHYLLEHKMIVTVLFRAFHVPCYGYGFMLNTLAEAIVYGNALAAHNSQFPFAKAYYAARMLQKRRRIGRDEVFPFAKADYQRAILAQGNYFIRPVRKHYCHRIGTHELRFRKAHGLHRVAIVIIIDKLNGDFAVRFGCESIPFAKQKRL